MQGMEKKRGKWDTPEAVDPEEEASANNFSGREERPAAAGGSFKRANTSSDALADIFQRSMPQQLTVGGTTYEEESFVPANIEPSSVVSVIASSVDKENYTEVIPSTNRNSTEVISTSNENSQSNVQLDNAVESVEYNPLFYGCRSVENYQRLNFIDQGTYGVVFKARCRNTNKIVALKQVKMGQLTSKMGFPITALREANILLHLRHPNIVEVKEMVVGSSIDKIFMVMEYCGSDLKSCIQKSAQSFSLSEIKCLMKQLMSGLAYMHNNGFIHRDLKTSNLLYTNGKLSICDFGMARKYCTPAGVYTREVVTLWYRAPELLLGAATYSTPLDVWSAGCIFGELVSGKPLFPGEGELDEISKIFSVLGAPSEELWPGCTKLPHFSKISYRVPSKSKLRSLFPMQNFAGGLCLNSTGFQLLSGMLSMDPMQRVSAGEAETHAWFTEDPLPMMISRMPTFEG